MNNKRRMKWIARVMALALTGTLMLGGAAAVKPVTAYAAGSSIIETTPKTGKLTIEKKNANGSAELPGATFEIYKVMSLTPGENPGEYASYKAEDPFAAVLTRNNIEPDALDNYSAADLEGIISDLKNVATKGNGTEKTTDDSGNAVFENLPLGYYLVVETAAPSGYVAGSPFLVAIPSTDNYNDTTAAGTAGISWVYDVTVQPKNAQVSINKKLDNAEDGSVKVDDYVKYVITTAIPNYPAEYTNAVFRIHDVMSDGLAIQNDNTHPIVVKVGGTPVDANDNTYTVEAQNKTGDAADLIITFNSTYIMTETNKGNPVEVTYYAKVTDKAVTGTQGNPNKVTLDYNHQPGEEAHAETPEVKVYSFNIKVEKFANEGRQKALSNAKFGLYSNVKCTDDVKIGEATSNDSGVLGFEKIDEGTYYLKEIASPKGYTLLTNPIKVEIIAGKDASSKANGSFTLEVNDGPITNTSGTFKTRLDVESGTAYVAVENHKGFSLPSTGGAGIAMFLIVGAAGIILVSVAFTRKSRKAN